MPVRLTDAEIAELVKEDKPLPDDFERKLVVKPKHGHKERELTVFGSATGHSFKVIVRVSSVNPMDFSAILAYVPRGSNSQFRLRRYNGRSHEHTNKLERQILSGFHIHQATERYQHSGLAEDAFAEATSRYADLSGALHCLLRDCGFVLPAGTAPDLFEKED